MKNGYYVQYHKGDIILSPFQNPAEVASIDENESFVWKTSSSLTSDQMAVADKKIFNQIDNGVNYWIQNIRYIPHLLVSAGVFLVLYMFFSLVIRDPIPIIDELVFSLIGAYFTWHRMSLKDNKSSAAEKKKLELKQKVSEASSVDEKFIEQVETFIEAVSKEQIIDSADWISENDFSHFPKLETENTQDFFIRFEYYLLHSGTGYSAFFDKKFSTAMDDKKRKIFAARIVSSTNSGKIDPGLFTLLYFYRFSSQN